MSDDDRPDAKRFNYNIYYGEAVLAAIPEGARTAVDVGCGEGFMARRLAERGLAVTAIDEHADSIRRARAQGEDSITYLEGDALTDALPAGPYDVVLAVASLHHMDLTEGLSRLKEPGRSRRRGPRGGARQSGTCGRAQGDGRLGGRQGSQGSSRATGTTGHPASGPLRRRMSTCATPRHG
ncbi:class I SAM-dependent methyltransferase [Demequina litorisediminis]|nr:class I SAM-dependent methyltransferase [Demequina litorisediminis]